MRIVYIVIIIGAIWGNSFLQNLYDQNIAAQKHQEALRIFKGVDTNTREIVIRVERDVPLYTEDRSDWRSVPTYITMAVIIAVALLLLLAPVVDRTLEKTDEL